MSRAVAREARAGALRDLLALLGLLGLLGGAPGCGPGADLGPGDLGATGRAVAVLHPTRGNEVRGVVRFAETGEGVQVVAEAAGLSEGPHAYHVHLYGDCTAPDGTSAGTHFNFVGSSKAPPEDIERITGNLGELVAGDDGRARHEARVELASLVGPKSIVGRSVVVHARGNDPDSPPIGSAGPRLACGVIGIAAEAGDGGSS